MAINYPEGLPRVRLEGLSAARQNPVLRTAMDAGPAKQRLRFTAVPTQISGSVILTQEEKAVFDGWFENELAYGTLRFSMSDPRDGSEAEFRFTGMPSESAEGGLFALSLPLERLP
ncbi:hypothetical protein [Treponema endosymbiont of Eucomonympha sp.]|uniref:hypothetical protein n=1 Tax=Treponema endosymbiont of Eucomonympha sp. TaxID=1580831 RepID=UPI000751A222|nr:hypothetical protein [Treponema endosymbiont of Eucomonympha sp.]